jgi:hypothetical protein
MPNKQSFFLDRSPVEPPPAGLKVLVQCVGYRGLAYRTTLGQWKTAADNRRLPGDVEILSRKRFSFPRNRTRLSGRGLLVPGIRAGRR